MELQLILVYLRHFLLTLRIISLDQLVINRLQRINLPLQLLEPNARLLQLILLITYLLLLHLQLLVETADLLLQVLILGLRRAHEITGTLQPLVILADLGVGSVDFGRQSMYHLHQLANLLIPKLNTRSQ